MEICSACKKQVKSTISVQHKGKQTPPVCEACMKMAVETIRSAKLPDAESWAEIVKARDDVRQCQVRTSDAHERYKDAKSSLDAAQAHLCELLDEAVQPHLFNQEGK